MNDMIQSAREDLGFLRALAEEGPGALARDGATLMTVGLIFSPVTLFYFLVFSGVIAVSSTLQQAAWIVGVVAMIAAGPLLRRRFRDGHTSANRAVRAGMTSVGVGITVAGLATVLAAWRMDAPEFVHQAWPITLFTLYGAAWSVAYAARRRTWMAVVMTGCFAAVLALGFFAGQATTWLILSASLLLLVAAPGYALVTGKV